MCTSCTNQAHYSLVRMCTPCSKPYPPPNWRSRSRVFVTSYHVLICSGTGAVHTRGPHIRMSVFHVHLVPLHHPVLSLYNLTRLYIHYGVFTIMYMWDLRACIYKRHSVTPFLSFTADMTTTPSLQTFHCFQVLYMYTVYMHLQ